MDEWWVDGWVEEWTGGRVDEWWVCRWMDEWMDGW